MTRPLARTIILTDEGPVDYDEVLAAYDGTLPIDLLGLLDAVPAGAGTILAGDNRRVNGEPLNAQLAAISTANTAHAAANADHAARLAALGDA